MYQPMLFLHWKQVRIVLIPFIVASFGLPLYAVHQMGGIPGIPADTQAYMILAMAEGLRPVFPALAAANGIMLALSAWNWDHQVGHVYSLSLPIPRWRFATLKMGAGAALALLPAAAFWAGSLVAASSVALPAGLHAYPNALALRFFMVVLVSYAVVFAMASGTVKTATLVVSAVLAFLIIGGALSAQLSEAFPALRDANLVTQTIHVLAGKHGPFEVFSGAWSLIDV